MTTGDPTPEPPGRPWPPDGALGSPQPVGAPTTWASPEDEEAMRLVAARLRSAHPGADPATVDAVVAGAYDELRDAKVRTFIPILTERRARALLAMPPPVAMPPADTQPAPES